MASWRGRGKGRLPGQPTLTFSSGPGFGGGRASAQVTLSLRSGPGLGSGRSGAQPNLQSATGHTMTSWSGRGGGRTPAQPNINPATGQSMTNFTGRGGGRTAAQPLIQPATGKDSGSWVGRGGGPSPMQPKISNANIMAAKRAMLNQASNMAAGALGAAGSALGGFFGSGMGRELEDPMGSYVFALDNKPSTMGFPWGTRTAGHQVTLESLSFAIYSFIGCRTHT